MHQLETFSTDDLVECSAVVRRLGDDTTCMEEAADRIARHLHTHLITDTGSRATALVRFYATQVCEQLPPDLRQFAETAHGGPLADGSRCLTLLATVGVEAAWNDRRASAAHQAIPLTTASMLERSPMIARLVADFGLDFDFVLNPTKEEVIHRHHQNYGVFHVAKALGSPAVPAQDFVRAYGIESVVGIGGVLPSGDLFAVILFATVPVSADVADRLRSLAISVKASIVRHTYSVFEARSASVWNLNPRTPQ